MNKPLYHSKFRHIGRLQSGPVFLTNTVLLSDEQVALFTDLSGACSRSVRMMKGYKSSEKDQVAVTLPNSHQVIRI